MLTSTPVTPIVYEGDFAHGPHTTIHMDNGGRYVLRAMTTPHGDGMYLTISSHDGASSCVSSLTVFGSGTCYIHWIDGDDEWNTAMWSYEGIDTTPVLWQFLMTLSLGSVSNMVKRTTTEARNCETVPEEEAVAV